MRRRMPVTGGHSSYGEKDVRLSRRLLHGAAAGADEMTGLEYARRWVSGFAFWSREHLHADIILGRTDGIDVGTRRACPTLRR